MKPITRHENESVVPFYLTLRRLRVVSTCALIFAGVCQWQFLMWLIEGLSLDSIADLENVSVGAGMLFTGVQGGLALTFRFIFQFAAHNPPVTHTIQYDEEVVLPKGASDKQVTTNTRPQY